MKIKLTKVRLYQDVWALQVGQHTIGLKRLFDIILIAALLVFAYNIGVHDAQEMVKLTAYLSTDGLCNQTGCYICQPMAEGNRVVWHCRPKGINNTMPLNYHDKIYPQYHN